MTGQQITKKFLLTTCGIAIGMRPDLSRVVGARYWVVTTAWATPSDTIGLRLLRLTIAYSVFTHRSFSTGRCRSWWYRIQNSFSLITHGDSPFPFSSPPGSLFRHLDCLSSLFRFKLFMSSLYCRKFNLSRELFYAFTAFSCSPR